jgi:ABC-type dipeptide/oligopeptide/nickel transport system permease component
MGRFMLDAINQRDYPVVQGVNLLLASIVVFVNLLVDLTYAYLDPRIRYQ